VSAIESLGWDFSDLIASADAVIGKPGYGTFVEAACNGTPMLYADRPGWPEQDALIPWLHQHARARQVGAQALRSGALAEELAALWRLPAPIPTAPSGVEEVAAMLASNT
jgi:UDP-N-acetylglucosamine:LPS N-acetylglucosamine transferase